MFESMSRASVQALSHDIPVPPEPAGVVPAFEQIGIAIDEERRRGRGAQSNASGRYEAEARVAFDDGWQSLDDLPPFRTSVTVEKPRTIINRNDSPDRKSVV